MTADATGGAHGSAAPVHPLWRPFEPATVEELDRATIGGEREKLPELRVEIAEFDPSWNGWFEHAAELVRVALGDRVLGLEHVGSTAVDGLAAKPIVDIDLIVADSAHERAYVPDLEKQGFALTIREPDWDEHRMLVLAEPRVNLHVFSVGALEPQRHVLFRDHLRRDAVDRQAYADLKRELAEERFDSVGEYNAAKSGLIYAIYERAFAADPRHEHAPRPIDAASAD